MTLRQLIAGGHIRVRHTAWADPADYLLLAVTGSAEDRRVGPWAYLYAPLQVDLGTERPQASLVVGHLDEDAWVPYPGAPAADEVPPGQFVRER